MPSLQPQFSPEHLAAVKRYRKLEKCFHLTGQRAGSRPTACAITTTVRVVRNPNSSRLAWLPGERPLLAARGESAGAGLRSHSDRCQGTRSLRSCWHRLHVPIADQRRCGRDCALQLIAPSLGFSLGAETAARLAATHPGLVRTVIVAGADDQAPQPQSFVNSPGSGMVPVVCGLPQGTQNPDARGAHGLLTALASPWRAAVA